MGVVLPNGVFFSWEESNKFNTCGMITCSSIEERHATRIRVFVVLFVLCRFCSCFVVVSVFGLFVVGLF